MIGATGFGGPAGQVAILHRELVERRRWLDEDEFLAALRVCMLLPGPEAQQLATYAGWRRGGLAGGLLAGTLFVLPGAALVTALAAAAFLPSGLLDPPAVVVSAIAAMLLLTGRLSTPLVVLGAAAIGAVTSLVR